MSNLAITIGTICAERLMYLPSAGVLIAAAVGAETADRTAASRRRRIAYAALAVVLVSAPVRTDVDAQSRLEDRLDTVVVRPSSPRRAALVCSQNTAGLMMGRAEDAARAGRTADAETLYAEARAHLETAREDLSLGTRCRSTAWR